MCHLLTCYEVDWWEKDEIVMNILIGIEQRYVIILSITLGKLCSQACTYGNLLCL